MKARTATLTLALTAAMGAAGIAHAAENPFAMNTLSQGYMVAAADKAQDGKCGGSKGDAAQGAKSQDGKCGGTKEAKAKAKDGKCGEGKCGSKK